MFEAQRKPFYGAALFDCILKSGFLTTFTCGQRQFTLSPKSVLPPLLPDALTHAFGQTNGPEALASTAQRSDSQSLGPHRPRLVMKYALSPSWSGGRKERERAYALRPPSRRLRWREKGSKASNLIKGRPPQRDFLLSNNASVRFRYPVNVAAVLDPSRVWMPPVEACVLPSGCVSFLSVTTEQARRTSPLAGASGLVLLKLFWRSSNDTRRGATKTLGLASLAAAWRFKRGRKRVCLARDNQAAAPDPRDGQ